MLLSLQISNTNRYKSPRTTLLLEESRIKDYEEIIKQFETPSYTLLPIKRYINHTCIININLF